MTYDRKAKHYGGENPPDDWTPTNTQLATAERSLHRPHTPRLALAYTHTVTRHEGYLAPGSDYTAYRQCRICWQAWPCTHADTCVIDGQPWPCDTTKDTTP